MLQQIRCTICIGIQLMSAPGHERLPGTADRADLAYTEAVLHESMRMASVVPIGLPHSTTCDTMLGLYFICMTKLG